MRKEYDTAIARHCAPLFPAPHAPIGSTIEPASNRLQISRAHFAVDFIDGEYRVEDRGSTYGTLVSGQRLGGRGNPAAAPLRPSALIVVGSNSSPYVFRFEVRPAAQA